MPKQSLKFASRSTSEVVVIDHLACREAGELEADIARNYHADAVVLTLERTYHGPEGVRDCRRRLEELLGSGEFVCRTIRMSNEFALIEWRSSTAGQCLIEGADSFVIEQGKIKCQTIRYSVQRLKKQM
jgi:hypothetical protein